MSESFEKFLVGTQVQVVWSDDGEWYDATIESHTPNGYYVTYKGWGNKEEVDPANVRPVDEGVVNTLLVAEKEAEATKQAIKRKIAQAADVDFQSRTLPAKLRIKPNDPEDVVSLMYFIPDEYLQPLKDQIVKDTVGELMKTFKQQLQPETFAYISQTLGALPSVPDLENDEQRDNERIFLEA